METDEPTAATPVLTTQRAVCFSLTFSMLFSPVFQRYSFSDFFLNLCVNYRRVAVGKVLYLAIFLGCRYF